MNRRNLEKTLNFAQIVNCCSKDIDQIDFKIILVFFVKKKTIGQWLWLRWRTYRFRYQRSAVLMENIYIQQLFTVTFEETKNMENRGRERHI